MNCWLWVCAGCFVAFALLQKSKEGKIPFYTAITVMYHNVTCQAEHCVK